MRILFVTQDDPLYIPQFFERFFHLWANGYAACDIVGIASQPAFNTSTYRTARRLLHLYGAVDFARLLAWWAGRKACDRCWRMTGLARPTSVASLTTRYGFLFTETADVNGAAFVAFARSLEPDLIVSVSAAQMFRRPLLEVPHIACLNIHNGALPAYRGMMPNFWQLDNGESAATTTIHTMGERLDTGTIVSETRTPISAGMTLNDLIVATKRQSADALAEAIKATEAQNLPQQRPVEAGAGSYYGFPGREDARRLRRKGHRLL